MGITAPTLSPLRNFELSGHFCFVIKMSRSQLPAVIAVVVIMFFAWLAMPSGSAGDSSLAPVKVDTEMRQDPPDIDVYFRNLKCKGSRSIAKHELINHASETSFWLAIANHVFDVTTFADKHPGGRVVRLPNSCSG